MRGKVYFEWGYSWRCWAVGVVIEKNDAHILFGPAWLHWDWS